MHYRNILKSFANYIYKLLEENTEHTLSRRKHNRYRKLVSKQEGYLSNECDFWFPKVSASNK